MSLVRPSLLLSPDGSFDRNGVVSPTVGTSVTVVAGQYGQAWRSPGTGSANNRRVTVPTPPGLSGFTVITRLLWETNSEAAIYPLDSGANGVRLGRSSSGNVSAILSGSTYSSGPAIPTATWVVLAAVYAQGILRLFLGGELLAIGQRSSPTHDSTIQVSFSSSTGSSQPVLTETALLYPVALPSKEIARISAMPAAWTMDNSAARVTSRLHDQAVGLGVRVA